MQAFELEVGSDPNSQTVLLQPPSYFSMTRPDGSSRRPMLAHDSSMGTDVGEEEGPDAMIRSISNFTRLKRQSS